MDIFDINWVGIDAENGRKLLLSVLFIAAVLAVSAALRRLVSLALGRTDHATRQTRFWTRQGVSLLTTLILLIGLLSTWFNDPARLATAFGLMSAGPAFALQQVITSIAGYVLILRGATFTVGDRTSMGGVRGDVLRLGFIQTTIMDMGQPPGVQGADPVQWVKSRQFTGRIVTVSHPGSSVSRSSTTRATSRSSGKRWSFPSPFKADRGRAESVPLQAAAQHAVPADSIAGNAKRDPQRRFGVAPLDLVPQVYFRITDNWLALSVRFLVSTHGIRNVKDAMGRRIVDGPDKAGIGIASATYDIVGFPAIEVRTVAAAAPA